MQINYCCPYWGSEDAGVTSFFERLKADAYDGIEVFFNNNRDLIDEFIPEIEDAIDANSNFKFILMHIAPHQPGTVDNYIDTFIKQLKQLTTYQPDFINSHTGKDFFSFDDNCRVIEAAMNISSKTGIRVLHETHRGRFSFHSATLLPYLKKFPEMELVADFSHFCVVSESLLQDQEAIIEQIFPHVSHIHARIGHEQGPQVNDPEAPEWENHFTRFTAWWQAIVMAKEKQGWKHFTITPEHGPFPYMPQLPYSKHPLSNQWNNNVYIMNRLKTIIG